jgi:DNA-binding NarL/FixJ family response regulator
VNSFLHILIIEPSAIIYEGLSAILHKSGINLRLYRAKDLENLNMANKRIDIVILNPSLVQNHVKTFNTLKNEWAGVKWLALVYAFFDQQLLSLFDAVISISDMPDVIIHQVKKAKTSDTGREQNPSEEVLSERETDVLRLLATGHANKEIADKLNISTNTVITHRKNISQKTGIKSVSGLTIYAVVKKLISIESIQE